MWGASGGNTTYGYGGYGSYTAGLIVLKNRRKIYLNIGAHGSSADSSHPYNGGGRGGSVLYSTSRGGCTDIRLKSGSDFESLKSRIIVSSGGGGATTYRDASGNGGSGGVYTGYPGGYADNTPSLSYTVIANTGGTIDQGGTASKGTHSDYSKTTGNNGAFGYGGDVRNNGIAGGGGCGYFGGGSGDDGNDVVSAGAGGSSYVSGYQGFKAIDPSSTSETNYKMLSDSYHSSGFFFTNVVVADYSTSFPSPSQSTEKGHVGNGAIAITVLNPNYATCEIAIPIPITYILLGFAVSL
ncbi:glycine-rich protein family [Trichomonas vaginalis G3]|uniref:glycine-rich protein family n=1 Tax=Trichomonas vaginalis (strain ATCC PRA-98 / G3) TaxID=412133 RepID=UPI0021E54733|nr:glycine-rich protein family [Trichomonas vaginalis G3]KAI5502822.1 glycine-rich protein family [Trichomonas vaginalis G3]